MDIGILNDLILILFNTQIVLDLFWKRILPLNDILALQNIPSWFDQNMSPRRR